MGGGRGGEGRVPSKAGEKEQRIQGGKGREGKARNAALISRLHLQR